MKALLIFAGTTEGRRLSELLSDSGIAHTVCVATEYGEMVLKEHPLAKIHRGRMDRDAMEKFIRNGDFAAVVDATHPYAKNVTENIKAAMEGLPLPYLRLKRNGCCVGEEDRKSVGTETEESGAEAGKNGMGRRAAGMVRYFHSHEACAQALKEIDGNILLTTGSKDLARYTSEKELKDRLYVRVLPGMESLKICMEQGICGKQILALQGPFSTELNEALIHQYRISCLVTKNGGIPGGYPEKLEAARRCRIPVFVIGREIEGEGYTFREMLEQLKQICGRALNVQVREAQRMNAASRETQPEIFLAGIGMGSERCLTNEVSEAIQTADILLGAERMIDSFEARIEKQPYYKADQIIPYLKTVHTAGKIVILFSGDTGCYSGCQFLYRALQKEIEAGKLSASVRILPGISSVSWLASCIGESYHDAAILSVHGKKQPNLLRRLKWQEKTFLLTSGAGDVRALGKLLMEAGMSHCQVVTGYQMSYPEQQIVTRTPEECLKVQEDGLYICFVKNPEAEQKPLTHGIPDSEFLREKIPMTKEEVREVSICKLKLHETAVVYDIGSGSGSIAVELAGLSDTVQVFALERKPEAVSLIKRNQEKWGLENITVVEAEAPEGISALPAPTHAFIGGSGGRLKEILSVLYEKNPKLRVVINAVSLETIAELREILSCYPVANEEVVQLQVSRTRKAGSHHLLQAENPVWICAFNFVPGED